jgi:hypothetical protein
MRKHAEFDKEESNARLSMPYITRIIILWQTENPRQTSLGVPGNLTPGALQRGRDAFNRDCPRNLAAAIGATEARELR